MLRSKICRKICGITKPTKPINPLTATEAPIAIETEDNLFLISHNLNQHNS